MLIVTMIVTVFVQVASGSSEVFQIFSSIVAFILTYGSIYVLRGLVSLHNILCPKFQDERRRHGHLVLNTKSPTVQTEQGNTFSHFGNRFY